MTTRSADTRPVSLEIDSARVAVITLASPPANALSDAVISGLRDALDDVEAAAVGCVVIASGVDGYFAAGADLKLMACADSAEFDAYLDRLREPIERLAALELPSIAAIDGHALGGGLELALACSLRVVGAGAKLGLPEIKLGLLPGAGGTQRLPRTVGRGQALDLLLTGRSMDAAESLRCGLADRLADGDARATAVALGQRIAAHPPAAVAAALRCVDAAARLPLTDGLAAEAGELQTLFDSDEARERLAAFAERRHTAKGS